MQKTKTNKNQSASFVDESVMGSRNISQIDWEMPEVRTAKPELKQQVKEPPCYKVLLLDDDYTPMEFVVEVLERYFTMNEQQATMMMLQVHTQGRGICGVFTRDIAETKVALVNAYSAQHEHPLLCCMEPE